MVDTDAIQKAVELINKSKDILITSHTKPDGDACGCIAAMCDALGAFGKNVTPLLLSAVPQWYEFLFAEKAAVLGEDVQIDELTAGRFGQFDLILIVDTNSHSQLAKFNDYLKQNDKPILILDHHETSDGLGDVELVDSDAAATGLIVLDLLKYAGWPVTEKIAESLFVALATDTGWFRFSNTNSRVYRACAELIDAGAKPTQIYDHLYLNFSYPRFRLMAGMLDKLELHLDGRYAAMQITREDFERTGAAYSDTENLINECHRIDSVKASALFIELKDGRIRCSLRSRGHLDVSKIAAKFGGGGHTMAAGTFLPGPLENAKQIILTEVEKRL
ncbi:MAG TPA: bifunctional oligoribonuclease/PAP phosphatase NrnA [Sedimentisphaerales bacterium]|nr:bifunctional oligoribonuclease/PAP phosphatase NrnA [Sedimentisphaerales bacterium]